MKRATAPKAVVFDLDGTLLDSLSFVLEALQQALKPYGQRPTMDIFPQLGGPPEKFLQALVPDPRHVPVVLERLAEYHRVNGHLLRPFPGVAALLEELQRRGVRIAIWTGRDRVSTAWLLQHHGLERYFGAVVCGDDLPTHKPSPEGLLEIMRRLDVTPGETVFVGDADVDVLGGVSCGVDTLLIRHGREVDGALLAKCWHAVSSPQEAFDALLALVKP
ncbi:MAG TPA: HAD family hydrolase [Opitutaceae bacterium]|nr:HAD family hydrolase [Opitutaceae bacterium]